MKILDATCGFRGIWYQKNHPFVTFMDKRKETFLSTHQHQNKRTYIVNPDIVSEWKDAPFPSDYFDMVIFDPPHLIWKNDKKESTLDKQYGYLYEDTYKTVLQQGIKKLFDILKPEGIFILKWCDVCKPLSEIIKLCPYEPLFGTETGHKNNNHWVVFIKYRPEKPLLEG